MSFRELAPIPDVQHEWRVDLTAVIGADGRPTAWLFLGVPRSALAETMGIQADHQVVWRLEGLEWRLATDLGPRGQVAFGVSGERVVVVRAVIIDEVESTYEIRTSASADSGISWTETPQRIDSTAWCEPGVAAMGVMVAFACWEGDTQGLWVARFHS